MENTSLNGSELNIARDFLPQLSPEQLELLQHEHEKHGGKIERTTVNPLNLKPIQHDFDVNKIISLSDTGSDKPIIVSRDNYIVDGHHRWIASKGKINVLRFDLSILELLKFAKEITTRKTPLIGIKEAATSRYRTIQKAKG